MKKGLKKFTVPYSGRYFDGGRIYGQRVVFAENAEAATQKVQKTFDDMMSPLCMPARLQSGFTARLAIAKYIRIGSSNTSTLGGLSIVGTAAAC